MDDMNTFERQVAADVLRTSAPPRPVDDLAVFNALTTTTQSPKWRFQSMFSAIKFVVAGVIVALFGGFLLSGVLMQQPSDEMAPAAATTSEPGTFSQTDSLDEARYFHTATLLPDGRVLVVGGEYPDVEDLPHRVHAAPAEVWDPATAAFSPAGSLIEARSGHTATLLADGRVLVVGGYAYDDCDTYCLHQIADAEVWDPETESFDPAGSLVEARGGHTATLLPDGHVLIVGGADGFGELASAEVWDPEAASFSAADGFGELASAEVWDPEVAAFVPAGSFAFAYTHDGSDIVDHTATRLPDGDFLVVGGGYFVDVDTADERYEVAATATVWDPETASFDAAGSLDEGREGHTATLLPDGRVLVAGGSDGDGSGFALAEVWDPRTSSFGPAGSLAEERVSHTATLLPDGQVLIVGGEWDGALASAEVWSP